jgi:hypothetical protein
MRTSLVTLCACLLPGCVWTGNGVAKEETRSLGAFDTIEATDIVDVVVREGGPVDGVSVYCDENVIEMLETRVSGGILTVGFRGGSVSTSTACEVVTGNMDIVEIVSLGIADMTVEGPVWSLDTIRSESVGNIRVELRPAQLEEAPADDGAPLLEGSDAGAEAEDGAEAEEGELVSESESEAEAGSEVEEEAEAEGESVDDWPYDDPEMDVQADHLFIESLDLGEIRVTGLDRSSVEVRSEGIGEIDLAGDVDLVILEIIDLTDVDARDLVASEARVFADGTGDITVTALERVEIENHGIGSVTVYGDPAERSVVNDSVGEVEFR